MTSAPAQNAQGPGQDFWPAWLAQNIDLYYGIKPGSRIGLVSNREFSSPKGIMLVLEFNRDGIKPAYRECTDLQQVEADVVFVFNPEVMEQLKEAQEPGASAPFLGNALRRGSVVFYSLTGTEELEDKGYADFFAQLGLNYVRGCVG